MFATFLCIAALLAIFFVSALCWLLAETSKRMADSQNELEDLRQKYANLENKCNFYTVENKKLRESNNSLSFQLMQLANQSSRRTDHNEGD